MDRRMDIEALRMELDQVIEGVADGDRTIIERDGRAVAMVVGLPSAHEAFGDALERVWADVRARDLPPMTMEEINEEIAAYRAERRGQARTT